MLTDIYHYFTHTVTHGFFFSYFVAEKLERRQRYLFTVNDKRTEKLNKDHVLFLVSDAKKVFSVVES